MLNAKALLGKHDVLLATFDTLRYDVAVEAWRQGRTPQLVKLLPPGGWEKRHSPGSFTYAAHHAFFAGFLPTPARPGKHVRLFAAAFVGSETIVEQTCVFDAPDIVRGFAAAGYHTLCIGGVGFFNRRTPLSRVLPGLFEESHWSEEMGVTHPDSTRNQVRCALNCLSRLPADRHLFLFLNISALHQPNHHYTPGATEDSPATQMNALAYVDGQLPPLIDALRRRHPLLAIFCSDHGTAYGEDGYTGHRLAHPAVWTVPYAEMILPRL